MGMKKRNRTSLDSSAQKRRNEIAALLVSGILKVEPAIKPLAEKLSNSSQKALELSPETMLSVSII
jgi:predicted transcriptional regulator YheO